MRKIDAQTIRDYNHFLIIFIPISQPIGVICLLNRKNLREFAIIAAAVYFFMLPSHVSAGSGAALNPIVGAYNNQPPREIITIMDKQEYRRLMDYIKKTDPKAFIAVYSVSHINYQPKVRA